MKKLRNIILIVVGIPLIAAIALLLYLTVTEYRPTDIAPAELAAAAPERMLAPGERLSILSFNVGYGGLDAGADFFMDGGSGVNPGSEEEVERNLSAIAALLAEQDADVTLLQEVDADSSRTFRIDERPLLARGAWAYALNYSCDFVPYPLPPIGRVRSGLMTASELALSSAERVALPCPFSWPVRLANLKRCLLVSTFPLAGTERKLVVVNLHLEAYDDGEGKRAQTAMLRELLAEQYAAGNYVIAGGDFNQTFPGSLAQYPILQDEYWAPGVLDEGLLPEGWRYAYDTAAPSCRLLNQPLEQGSAETQYYVIDGFILSPNVELARVETLPLGFESSDHNPVRLEVRLK